MCCLTRGGEAARAAPVAAAFRCSLPVLCGYLAIGVAFGLLLRQAGYPWYLALVMSAVMYAGSAQYIAVGLFASGAALWEAALIQLIVNARHIAYGLAMRGRYRGTGRLKPYLVFALTDETFALLSSSAAAAGFQARDRRRFMFCVSLFDHAYWVAGSVLGALAGGLLPFKIEGIGFALTALFIVLMIEQIYAVRRAAPFAAAACAAVFCVLFAPARASLLSALVLSLACARFLPRRGEAARDA